jgi:hypothetical protein
LLAIYDVERGPDGVMKVEAPPAKSVSLKDLFRRKCFLLGITEPWKVAKLWAEEVERRKRAQDAEVYRPSGRHGRRAG